MEVPSPNSSRDGSLLSSNEEAMTAIELPKSSTPSMFRSLADVFENAVPQEYTGPGFDGWPKILDDAGSDFENDKALRTVVSILQYLKEESPVTLVPATKILADGSRQGKLFANLLTLARTMTKKLAETCLEKYRLSFGDEKVLDFYLDLLGEDEKEPDWTSDALRLVGNSCADLSSYPSKALWITVID